MGHGSGTEGTRGGAAILLAAGSSTRMGGEDKLWADLGGRPVVAHSVETLAGLEEVATLVVVAPAARHEALRALFEGTQSSAALVLVEGGARRRDSVGAGIAAAPAAAWYLVHDAARPLASTELMQRVLEAARARGPNGAAIPGVPVVDTIKRVDAEGRVLETPPRELLRAVQTPQAFAGDLLRRAHAATDEDATDDAALVERLGAEVVVVDGEAMNLKVTTPTDLETARRLLDTLARGRSATDARG